MNMEKEEEGVVVKGRATIDSRPPFRSVKEAVSLFGERVLVGEVYANQLKQIESKASVEKEQVSTSSTKGTVASAELVETKQDLKKAKEEGNYMANCLKSLREELEQTKRELQHLKSFEHPKAINPEIDELKIVEINPPVSRKSDLTENTMNHQGNLQHELQKKKFVSFASPPSLTRTMNHNVSHGGGDANMGRTPSFRKEGKKKKPLVPIMGWIFPRKKTSSNYEVGAISPKARS